MPKIATAEELFRDITGCDYQDRVALEGLHDPVKMKPHIVHKTGVEQIDTFETAWEKSQLEAAQEALLIDATAQEAPLIDPVNA